MLIPFIIFFQYLFIFFCSQKRPHTGRFSFYNVLLVKQLSFSNVFSLKYVVIVSLQSTWAFGKGSYSNLIKYSQLIGQIAYYLKEC